MRTAITSRPDKAYSLVELMLAMGILAVGLMMIGTTLPAGMLNADQANQDTMSTIVLDNAAGIVRNELHHGTGLATNQIPGTLSAWFWDRMTVNPAAAAFFQDLSAYNLANNPPTSDIGLSFVDRFYPRIRSGVWVNPNVTTPYLAVWPNVATATGVLLYNPAETVSFSTKLAGTTVPFGQYLQPSTRFSWMLLGRPTLPSNWTGSDPIPNDYEFVIVAIRRHRPEEAMLETTFVPVRIRVDGTIVVDSPRMDGLTLQVPFNGQFPPGTLVIKSLHRPIDLLTRDSDYAWTSQEGVLMYGGQPATWQPVPGFPDTPGFAVVDIDPSGVGVARSCPALGCQLIRTPLNP